MSSNIKNTLNILKENERSELLIPKDWSEVRSSLECEYDSSIPYEIIELYEFTNGGFVHVRKHDTWRIFTPNEILKAPLEFKVNFNKLALLPFIDVSDNDFICYDFSKSQYTMYNIVDNIDFDNRAELFNFLEPIL